MKRLFIYLLVVGSITVFAQQMASEMAGEASGEEPGKEQPANPGQDNADGSPQEPGAADEGNGEDMAERPADEQPSEKPGSSSAGGSDDQAPKPGDDDGPSDEDFEPDEEISEDYPVPLPSDI